MNYKQKISKIDRHSSNTQDLIQHGVENLNIDFNIYQLLNYLEESRTTPRMWSPQITVSRQDNTENKIDVKKTDPYLKPLSHDIFPLGHVVRGAKCESLGAV